MDEARLRGRDKCQTKKSPKLQADVPQETKNSFIQVPQANAGGRQGDIKKVDGELAASGNDGPGRDVRHIGRHNIRNSHALANSGQPCLASGLVCKILLSPRPALLELLGFLLQSEVFQDTVSQVEEDPSEPEFGRGFGDSLSSLGRKAEEFDSISL